MEEERIKSAFELAMERISALPELTPEEKEEQKERECAPVGISLAYKYMEGTLADTDLPVELERCEGSRRQIVRRALITSLCREMSLEKKRAAALKALSGVMRIAPEAKGILQEAEHAYMRILDEFEVEKKKEFAKFQADAVEKLKARGISGTAVRINFDENEQWNRELFCLRQAYEPRLESIRDRIIRELHSN
ncbi:MAG: hypothetical protein JXA73_03725 [Acidobacteria bacterium]|nr:hypothetical protein [Acidobacteriota bacterium]